MGLSVSSGLLPWSGLELERRMVLLLFPVFVLGVTIYMGMQRANGVVTANEKGPTAQPLEWVTSIGPNPSDSVDRVT